MEYMGHTVNFKTEKTSFRDKRRHLTPKDSWVIFENTQEPIVDEETFQTAQKLRKTGRRPTSLGEANPLTGLLYCADCGARLYNERGDNGKGHFKDSYACSSYRKRTSDCTMHFIRSEVVRDLILSALRSISEYAKANREAFERLVMDTTSDRQAQQMKESRKALADGQRRYDELDVLIQRTYEDHVAGKLNDKRFLKLSQQYEAEQEQLESDLDDAAFLQRIKMTHVVHTEGGEGASATPHSIEAPYVGTQTAIDMLEKKLYQDFQAFDASAVQAGNQTATAIRASYVPLDLKTDKFERQVTEFILGILKLAGLDDEPTYTRSQIINKNEEIQSVLMAAPYVTREYLTRKLLTLLGDADMVEDILNQLDAENLDKFDGGGDAPPDEDSEDVSGDEA